MPGIAAFLWSTALCLLVDCVSFLPFLILALNMRAASSSAQIQIGQDPYHLHHPLHVLQTVGDPLGCCSALDIGIARSAPIYKLSKNQPLT